MKLNVQTKLLIGFISILLITIVIVSATSHYWLIKEVSRFASENDFKPEFFGPPKENPFVQDMKTFFILIAVVGGSFG